MPEVEAYLRPRSVEEALAAMATHGDRTRILAGGTSLVPGRGGRPVVIVDLRGTGLDRIEVRDDGLHVGAMATCSALRRHFCGRFHTAMSDAAGAVGTSVLRNHVTVGGNAVMAYAWSDLPPALLCLGARFVLAWVRAGVIEAAAFYTEHPTRVLGPGTLLTAAIVPPDGPGQGSAFLKFTRNAGDHAVASMAARLTLADGRIAEARIVAGGMRGLPQDLAAAAGSLVGHAPGPDAFARAGEVASGEARAMEDFKASAGFRQNLAGALAEDALAIAAARATGEEKP